MFVGGEIGYRGIVLCESRSSTVTVIVRRGGFGLRERRWAAPGDWCADIP